MKCPHCDGTGQLAPDQVNVGTMVLGHRKSVDMTQQELAMKAGLSRAQIANLEAGRTDVPTLTLRRIADALGCHARDLLP